MIHFKTVGEIADSGAASVSMGDNDDFVAAVDELGGELIDVRFNSTRLGVEEVADHGDVVRHDDYGLNYFGLSSCEVCNNSGWSSARVETASIDFSHSAVATGGMWCKYCANPIEHDF